ncbi:hypothetical protein DNTS_034771 [Danionella cerebrum]|uniref:Uncharacterized protein n=1 Tax=Danionella cerebrum TaxID=2873325 RepID=A0A553MXV1_9TELE|nr:hypothetical protein DNTS_034771 [Danionella translucida]
MEMMPADSIFEDCIEQMLRILKLSINQTERRSCVAVELCWLAVKVECCGAECLAVSSILLIAPV